MKREYLTFSDLGGIVKKHLLPLLLCALLFCLLLFALTAALPAKYAATSEYYVRNLQSEAFLERNGLTSSQLAVVQNLAKEYAAVAVRNDALLDLVIANHGLDCSREELRAMLSSDTDSAIFSVTVTAKDPDTARKISAAMEAELPRWINETAWPNLDSDTISCVILLHAAYDAPRATVYPPVACGVGAVAGFLLAYFFFFIRFLFCAPDGKRPLSVSGGSAAALEETPATDAGNSPEIDKK